MLRFVRLVISHLSKAGITFCQRTAAARIESFLLFACQTRRLMLMDTLFGMKQVFGKVHLYEFAKFSHGFLRFGQQIFVAKQLVVAEVLELKMDSRSLPILADYKGRAQLSYQPGEPRMLQHFDRSARRIVCLRHRHRSRVPCDMHDPAIRKPGEQFGNVSDVDRKLNTSPLAAAEPGNLFNQNSGDRSQASV